MAKKRGADAVKFQTYKAELLHQKNLLLIGTRKKKTKNQFELFKKYDGFEIKDYRNLYSYCKKRKLTFYQLHSMRMQLILEPMVPYFKIASADITNFPLLKKIGQKKKLHFYQLAPQI